MSEQFSLSHFSCNTLLHTNTHTQAQLFGKKWRWHYDVPVFDEKRNFRKAVRREANKGAAFLAFISSLSKNSKVKTRLQAQIYGKLEN